MVQADGIDAAHSYDVYRLEPLDALSDLAGKLFVEWAMTRSTGWRMRKAEIWPSFSFYTSHSRSRHLRQPCRARWLAQHPVSWWDLPAIWARWPDMLEELKIASETAWG